MRARPIANVCMGGNSSKEPAAGGQHSNTTSVQTESSADRHQGPIHSLCAIDQNSIISGGADKNVNLYNFKSCCYQARFSGPIKDVTKICYNNASKVIFAASRDRSLYGWKCPLDREESTKTAPREPSTILHGHSLGVTAVDTNNEYPQLLCSGSRDNSVCLWDLDIGKPISSMYAPRNIVTDLTWILEEKAVVQASEDKTLRVWDLTSCSTVQHFRARNYLQTCCDVSSNRQHFLAGSSGSGNVGGELTLWDRRNEKKPLRVFKGHSESVESCMFYSHGTTNLACSVSKDSTIRLWELDSGQELCCQFLSGFGSLTGIISPEKEILACSSFSGGISLWSLETADELWNLKLSSKYL